MTVRFTTADGVRLVADLQGDWAGPMVVLLHGGGQTRHSWRGTARMLAARRHFVVSIDLRGHGDSDWAGDGRYSMDAFRDDVAHVVDSFQRPAALVGASLGGLAAMLAAGETGIACSAVVLVDVAPHMQVAGRRAITKFMQGNPAGFDSVEEAADAVAAFLPHRPRPSDVSGLRRNLREGSDGRLYWHWDHRTLTVPDGPTSVTPPRFEAALRRIGSPILLVRGQLSDVVMAEDVARFQAIVPSSEYVDVAGAAHMVAGDQNDSFSEAIADFLGRKLVDVHA